ncbi:MAG: 3'(2'),5'-bisphosphate nucleotidase [Anaerolineales bacterium]|nr:3'(2'),5'-bisphosphate nucleotidase [Anaerolineales bacterium]
MIDITKQETSFAIQAVILASKLVKQVEAEMVSPALTKDDRSPVTVADFASQALVGYLLANTFPNDPLVGEEDSSALRTPEEQATLEQVTGFVTQYVSDGSSVDTERVCEWIDHGNGEPAERFWTLDPIDGTKGFLRGDQYVVALALIVDGQVQVGVLGCPNLTDGYKPDVGGSGSLVVAARGEGTWVGKLDDSDKDYAKVHVSNRNDPTQARLLRSYESGHTNVSQIDNFASALEVTAKPVRMDSQAKYAVLATGHGEYYLRLLSSKQPDYREKIWDQAAGSLLVEEAGGKVTDLHGNKLDFSAGRTLANNRGILASNQHLHPQAVKALRSIGV